MAKGDRFTVIPQAMAIAFFAIVGAAAAHAQTEEAGAPSTIGCEAVLERMTVWCGSSTILSSQTFPVRF